jgi:hypothetical protein
MAEGARHFLPWVRQGTAAGIVAPDSLTANQPAKASMTVTVKLAEFAVGAPIELYGPADVTAIDPRQVVRTEPRPFTSDYPYNLFPAIEFDRPDFPWLLTPAKAGANEKLRPWLCLIVVKKQDGVRLTRGGAGALPVLDIAAPARPALELPDPEEIWAWAHAQITGSVGDNAAALANAITQAPERTVSRLLCPRRLEPSTAYYACVVPAFDVGRKAGLGLEVTATDLGKLAPSWQLNANAVSLPVYYSWEFSSGETADFESLVRLLQPRPIGERVGTLPLDVGAPGFGLPQTDTVVPMRGALQPVALAATPQPPAPPALQTALAKLLNAPADARESSATDPVVAPPIYGAPYSPRERVAPTPTPPLWLDELNLDPRNRIAAALGTEIVQQDQEALMASAWQQAEALRRANLRQRRHQLALATRTATYARQVSRLDKDAVLQVAGQSMTRMTASGVGTRTAAAQVWSSAFPAFTAPTLRRVARPRGPLNRRFLPREFTATRSRRLVQLVDKLSSAPGASPRRGLSSTSPPPVVPAMVTIRKVSTAASLPSVDAGKINPAAVRDEPARGFFVWNDDHWERSTAQFGKQLREAALAHLDRVFKVPPVVFKTNTTPDVAKLLGDLNPGASGASVRALAQAGAEDDDLIAHPRFPRPMSERLIEIAPEFLLPGLEHVPANTITLVQANSRFIEAFMVGLNHEMGRELLWREYPTDRRGTYFKHFWDDADDGGAVGLPRIDGWTKGLGANRNASVGDPLILLLRGDLFRRYPNAILYAAKAERDAAGRIKPGATERFPLFRGTAPPDVTFFGFRMTEAEARGSTEPQGDPGWFFVLQQQPGEPDFGLDVDPGGQPAPVSQWNQLTWRHLVRTQAQLAELTHVKVKAGPDVSRNPPGATWGVNGAHMARITMQQAVRIAIHARQMLSPERKGNADA